ncbi:MAG: N-acetyltransferase [Betaproteobacteria bacterium HGW-Betaproteobacteria-8]|nr:MAG: N-acetyltransferase [Betaproteobacteria bacterium HGW-Betaproteobacteria-8]
MHLPDIIIETERLRLLPIGQSYAEEIFRNFTAEITRYMYPKPPTEISETLAFIDYSLKALNDGNCLQLVVTDKTTNEFLGCAGLANIGKTDPELGIWLKKSAHGSGYGLETITGIIAWARSNIEFEYLRYPVDRRNIASRRIPERNGGVASKEYRKTNQSGNVLDEIEYWIFR